MALHRLKASTERQVLPGPCTEVFAVAAAALETEVIRHKPEDRTGVPGAVSDGMVRALSSSSEGVSLAVANPKFVWITFCRASARSADGRNLR